MDDSFTNKLLKKKFSKFRVYGNVRIDGGGNGYKRGNFYAVKNKSEGVKNYQHDEDKKENKLLGDSCYNYNNYNGKNHFARECMLQKKNEKKNKEKDEP